MTDLFDWQKESEATEAAIDLVTKRNITTVDIATAEAVENLRGMPRGGIVTPDIILPDINKFCFTNNRSMGAVIRKLKNGGFIKKHHGQAKKSTRKGNHLGMVQPWVNLVGTGSPDPDGPANPIEPVPEIPVLELATRIADSLFTNAFGDRGDRLEIKLGQPSGGGSLPELSLGGWCFEAAVEQIAQSIDNKPQPAKKS